MPSSSNPSKTYETILYVDGSTSCNCRGWTFKKEGQERTCTHTRMVDQGIADRYALSVWNNPNLAITPAASSTAVATRKMTGEELAERNAERNAPSLSKVIGSQQKVPKVKKEKLSQYPVRKVNWRGTV